MRLFLLAFLCISVGCTGQRRPDEPPPTVELDPGVYRVQSGDLVERAELWRKLGDARFVVVAESHDDEQDHAIQLEVLKALDERGEVALGMEMFQRPFQAPLDEYVAGTIDEETMLQRTQWEERWGFPPALYAPLWRYAAEHDIPIFALNARRELTKRIAAVGLEGLSRNERADLPDIDLSGERYRNWMRDIFRAHGAEMEPEKFERFYQAQLTWDETMAETAVTGARAHPEATVVILAGRGHVERDFGIPSRIRRRIGAEQGDSAVVSIVPLPADEVPRFRWMRRQHFADYVWLKQP